MIIVYSLKTLKRYIDIFKTQLIMNSNWTVTLKKQFGNDHIIRNRTSQMFCKISALKNLVEELQENPCARVSFLIKLQVLKIHKKTPVIESCF